MEYLAALLPTSKATWLLVVSSVTTLLLLCPHMRAIGWGKKSSALFLQPARVVRCIRGFNFVLAITAYVPLLSLRTEAFAAVESNRQACLPPSGARSEKRYREDHWAALVHHANYQASIVVAATLP
jgi:hypothetical protein